MATHTYGFVLGLNHSLGKAEILRLLDQRKINLEVLASSRETLILKLDQQITARELIDCLGGTAKIIGLNQEQPYPVKELVFDHSLVGFSLYHSGASFKQLNQLWSDLPRLAKKAKARNKQLHFLPIKQRLLSTVSVDKNLLNQNGAEIDLCAAKNRVYLGQTLAVQDYQSYSWRDYSRPRRDPQQGLIPPKLAKIMINLTQPEPNDSFLDPFCGQGTFLQELLLLGYKNIYGSDLRSQAILDTQANLNWLLDHCPVIKNQSPQFNLKTLPVEKLSSWLPPNTITVIVSEPYLGSPKLNRFSAPRFRQEVAKVKRLYQVALAEFNKVLTKKGRVCLIIPVYRQGRRYQYLPVVDLITRLGFRLEPWVPKLDLQVTPRGTIVYYRPGQTVLREICLFKKAT